MTRPAAALPGSPAPAAAPDIAAVQTAALPKRYGDAEAVRGVSFRVAPGEIFAFLGPNGAGKTTMVRMLCTLARPTGGHATVAGFDVQRQSRAVRRRIGLVFQEQTLDDSLAASRLVAAGFQLRPGGDRLVVFADDGEAKVAGLIHAAGVPVRTVHVHRPTLDDVFLHYTGRQIRDSSAGPGLPMRTRAHVARRR